MAKYQIQVHLKNLELLRKILCELQCNNGKDRVVTKISSCRVNTTSRWRIKQLGVSSWFYFSSIFLLKQLGVTFIVARGNPQPQGLNDSPERPTQIEGIELYYSIIGHRHFSAGQKFSSCTQRQAGQLHSFKQACTGQ